jgi:hypothetical protein
MKGFAWLAGHLLWAGLLLGAAAILGAGFGLLARRTIGPAEPPMMRYVGWTLILGLAVMVSFAVVATLD